MHCACVLGFYFILLEPDDVATLRCYLRLSSKHIISNNKFSFPSLDVVKLRRSPYLPEHFEDLSVNTLNEKLNVQSHHVQFKCLANMTDRIVFSSFSQSH